jgi:hypothetical protein
MQLSKIVRLVVVYAGSISLAGVFYRMPLFFHMSNVGELSTLKLGCLLIACASVLVGILRFLLTPAAKGWPFAFALFACIPVLMGVPMGILSAWFVLMVAICAMGVFAGFWFAKKQAAPTT